MFWLWLGWGKSMILTLCLLCVELKKKVVRGPLSGSSFRQLTHVTSKSMPETSSESKQLSFQLTFWPTQFLTVVLFYLKRTPIWDPIETGVVINWDPDVNLPHQPPFQFWISCQFCQSFSSYLAPQVCRQGWHKNCLYSNFSPEIYIHSQGKWAKTIVGTLPYHLRSGQRSSSHLLPLQCT